MLVIMYDNEKKNICKQKVYKKKINHKCLLRIENYIPRDHCVLEHSAEPRDAQE